MRRDRRHPAAWALVAVAKDEATAEAWQSLLADGGIEAEVRIDDPARAGMPSRTGFPLGYMEPGLSLFSYPVYVRSDERRAARRLLRDRAEVIGPRLDGRTVLGAVAVVAGSLALVIILLLRDA